MLSNQLTEGVQTLLVLLFFRLGKILLKRVVSGDPEVLEKSCFVREMSLASPGL